MGVIFEIAELVDNYEGPAPGAVVWRAGVGGQRWPLFHPSEADPDTGYREHPYAVVFDLDEPADCLLRIAYLAIAPRVAHLELDMNGAHGNAYLRPAPSISGEVALRAGLHTSLYCDGEARVVVPAGLLRAGENRLVLVARDGGEVLRVENAEAVKRLDRMADAAGLVYRRLSLERLATCPATRASLHPSVVYRRGEDGVLRELCELDLELDGATEGGEVLLEADGEATPLTVPRAAFGHLRLPFELADGPPETTFRLSGLVEAAGTLRRRRKWRVYVAPHVHTDVGYTHRQWEVAERLARTIDDALALPEPAAFHLDSAFALETWLATRRPRPLDRIAVSGVYVDLLSQTAALEDLVRNGLAAERLLARAGRETDFVSVVDVPSLSGSLPAILEGSGLPYLVHASNQDRGPFRVNGGLHRLSPYWWEGPRGGRILVWLAKMYCELRKVCGSPPVPDSAARGLDLWLAEWEREDYLPDSVLLYGQEADNTDLDPQPAAFVRRWNDTYEWPRLVFSGVSDFFRDVERLGDRLPTARGDGGAYWEDGCGSAAAATAAARGAQADLPAAERLEALAALHEPARRFPGERFDEAWRQLLLWDEHTWGAFLSAREPDALLQADLWAVKERFGREAAGRAGDLLHAAAAALALRSGNEGREVVVHNPHSWPVSDAVRVEIASDEIVDAPARPVRRTGTQQVVEVWVDELPGLSSRRFPLRRGAPSAPREGRLENARYRLELDAERGCVRSLHDKTLDRELVETGAPWGFGQLVQALGGESTRLVSNRTDLPEADPRLELGFELRDVRAEGDAVTLTGAVAGGELEVEWTLPERAPWIDVRFLWRKEERRAKEAAYVAFPADLPGAAVLSDSQLGWVEWGADDLPGACQEWLPLQTGVLARGEGCELLVCSPDVPLFCVGDVVRGRWPVRKEQRGGRILSYVLNNYWHTNYRASQGSELTFRYRLTSAARIREADAYRLGWQTRRPPYAHRTSFQDFRPPGPRLVTLASVEPANVVLSALKGAASGDGFVARFQEIGGEPALARLSLPRPVRAAWRTDLLERDLEPLATSGAVVEIDLPAWALATVRFTT